MCNYLNMPGGIFVNWAFFKFLLNHSWQVFSFREWFSHTCSSLFSQISYFSALYVVDLKKFRKIAAGDRLRGQYQALSQDPNSLSNLDQVHNSEMTPSHYMMQRLFF